MNDDAMYGLVKKQLELLSQNGFDHYAINVIMILENKGIVFDNFLKNSNSYIFTKRYNTLDVEMQLDIDTVTIILSSYSNETFSYTSPAVEKRQWKISKKFKKIEFVRIADIIYEYMDNCYSFSKKAYLYHTDGWSYSKKHKKLLTYILDTFLSEKINPSDIIYSNEFCTFESYKMLSTSTTKIEIKIHADGSVDMLVNRHYYEDGFKGLKIFSVKDTLDIQDDMLASCSIFNAIQQ